MFGALGNVQDGEYVTSNLYDIILGSIILAMSVGMGATLLLAPGSIRLERPECGWVGWAFNIANLLFFFLLIPVSGVMLLAGLNLGILCCVEFRQPILSIVLELQGLIFFISGSFLLLWSRMSLRRSFRLGGVKPAATDYLTMHGPYNYIRHPMYLSALLVQVGVAVLMGSAVLLFMFFVMVYLVLKLIPAEEVLLDQAYPIAYSEYCRRVPGALFPRG
jgi:protein-S-isoprenylcysteine O-methyltransferase Ste14